MTVVSIGRSVGNVPGTHWDLWDVYGSTCRPTRAALSMWSSGSGYLVCFRKCNARRPRSVNCECSHHSSHHITLLHNSSLLSYSLSLSLYPHSQLSRASVSVELHIALSGRVLYLPDSAHRNAEGRLSLYAMLPLPQHASDTLTRVGSSRNTAHISKDHIQITTAGKQHFLMLFLKTSRFFCTSVHTYVCTCAALLALHTSSP